MKHGPVPDQSPTVCNGESFFSDPDKPGRSVRSPPACPEGNRENAQYRLSQLPRPATHHRWAHRWLFVSLDAAGHRLDY